MENYAFDFWKGAEILCFDSSAIFSWEMCKKTSVGMAYSHKLFFILLISNFWQEMPKTSFQF